jgi:hypothetical protein
MSNVIVVIRCPPTIGAPCDIRTVIPAITTTEDPVNVKSVVDTYKHLLSLGGICEVNCYLIVR